MSSENKSAPKKISQVYSTTLVDENGNLIDYCTLTIYKEKDNVEFSVISSNGNAFVGKQSYEDDEHWEETLKIIKKLPAITLYQDQSTAKIKKIGLKLTAVSLTDTQKLAFRVDSLEKEVASFREVIKRHSEWIPLEQKINLGSFEFSTTDAVSFQVSEKVPHYTTEILVNVLAKSKDSDFDAKLWTVKNGQQCYQLVRGSTGSFSQNIWLPFNSEEPTVFVQSSSASSAAGLTFDVIGYR